MSEALDLKLKEIEDLFQSLTTTILGVGSDVRISWPTEGAPAWGIAEDVVFLRVTEKDDPYNRLRNTIILPVYILSPYSIDPDKVILRTSYTRVISAFWTLYGPNSFDNAQEIRDCLFYDFPIREVLTKQKIYMVPDIVSPKRAPELFADQWWERTDMEVIFYELVVKERELSTVKSVEVIVENSEGVVADLDIS